MFVISKLSLSLAHGLHFRPTKSSIYKDFVVELYIKNALKK